MTVIAGKTFKSNCSNLCIADFRRKATIELRAIQAPNFGNTSPSESFSVIFTAYFFVQTLKGTKRFAGVNIEKETTHLYLARWRAAINKLDGAGQHFLRSRGILYRIVEITNINESDDYILFQCTERGLDTKQETNA